MMGAHVPSCPGLALHWQLIQGDSGKVSEVPMV